MKKFIAEKYNIIAAALFALAVAVRIIGFGSIPGGFNQDGALAAVDALSLARYGTDHYGMFMPVHLTAWGYGQMSSMLSYLMVPFIKLFGLSAVTARLPSLLCSLAGLLFLWLFARRGFSKSTALWVLLLGAVCPWHIMQSRWALDCNLFPHFLMAGMYLLLEGLKGRRALIYASMAVFGLSMYCYGISIYTVPLLLAALGIYLLLTKRLRAAELLIAAGVYLALAWPFILCMAVNALGLETIELPFCTIPYFQGSVRSSDILFFSEKPLEALGRNFISILRIIFQCSGDPLWNEIPGFGTLYYITIPFLLIGIWRTAGAAKRSVPAVMVLMLFGTAFVNGLITSTVNINRANMIFYPMLMLSAVGLAYVTGRFGRALIPLAAAYGCCFALFCFSYFTTYADSIRVSFMEDFGRAVSYAVSLDADSCYITPDSQYDGASHVSRVLTMFYGGIDAADIQSGEFSSRFSFSNPSDAEVLVTKEYEPGAVQFGSYYVIDRR